MITSREEAFAILAKHGIVPPPELVYKNSLVGMPIQEFMGTQCYLNKTQLMPVWAHVNLLLDLMFYPEKYGLPHFFVILYSTIKKSIKTTLGSVIARWVMETWDGKQECIFLASDAEQAKGRGYQMFRDTIELHPRYDKDKRILFGPNNEKLWDITDKRALYIPDGSFIKPVSSDYAGEAGGNPTASFYTELWTWRMQKDEKLFSEMTVPPTRPRGFRYIDSYAGYTGESNVLWKIWQRLQRDGRQLTVDDVPAWGVLYPDEPKLPVWVHLPSRSIGYIDQGIKARRFPWQLGPEGDAYYLAERAAAVNDGDYLRLNENYWAEPRHALMPIQWWDNCLDATLAPLKERQAVVIGCDASVTHDCTAMTLHSRHPVEHYDTVLREEAVWNPKDFESGEMNYDESILPQLVYWTRRYNVVSVVYDKFQLKYLMDRVATGTCGPIKMADGSIATLRALPVRSFNQQNERREADSSFVNMVRDRAFHHSGNCPITRQHVLNAAATHDTHENTKLHIVKRDDESMIDAVVSTAMGNYETFSLSI